jgi:polysaccharide pyruvyl transferase CsaB
LNKIAIHGFYGMGNLGDEAILASMLKEFRNYGSIDVVVFSRKPEQIQRIYGIRSISSEAKRDLLKRRSELKKCNLFILGGGGLLKDFGTDSTSLKKWLKLLDHANRLNKKTSLFAIGVENIRYNESKSLIQNALTNVDLITVRDKNSKDILESIGVENTIKVTTDPVVLLGESTQKTSSQIIKTKKPMKVAICIRHWYDKSFNIENPKVNENFIKAMASAAEFLIEQYDAKLEFIPMRTISYDDDRVAAKQIISHMKFKDNVEVINEVPEVNDFIKMLDQYSLLIGMRLHSLILGTSSGVPVIGLNYMPKVKAYMESIGQGKYSLELETITAEKIIKQITGTILHYDQRTKNIRKEILRLRKIAKDNIAELINLAT